MRLRYLGRLKGGAGFPDVEQGVKGAELPFFKVKHLSEADADGCLRFSEHTVSRDTAAQLGAFIFPAGTIVFAKVGAALLLNRFMVLGQESCIDNNMMGLVTNGERIDLRFMLHSLALVDFGQVANPGAVPSLNTEQVAEQVVPLPPLDIQKRTADYLDRETARLDALVAAKERVLGLLAEKRRALITRAVTRGLDPRAPLKDTGVAWLPQVQQHWMATKVSRLFRQSKRLGFADLTVLSVYRDYGVIERSTRDDNVNRVPDDLEKYQLVEAGDLVINKMKAWQGSLGIAEMSGITSPDYVVFSPLHREVSRFIHYLLRNPLLTTVYLSMSNGIRTSQWRLEPDRFGSLGLFLPPHDEQRAIVARIDAETGRLDTLVAATESTISLLKERRAALIAAAVTGQIDVRQHAKRQGASHASAALS